MIIVDLEDRVEYKISEDWSVRELICVECPKCDKTTVEVITYPDMTLYYHISPHEQPILGSAKDMGLCMLLNTQDRKWIDKYRH